VAPPGNQAANGENKPQPAVSGETGLLDSIGFLYKKINRSNKFSLSFRGLRLVSFLL